VFYKNIALQSRIPKVKMSKKNIILIVACTAVFFEALDIAIINLALPLIQKEFFLANDAIQWLQTLYVLPYGGFLIIGGKLADQLGRKKIFMLGSLLFLITSLGAGFAENFETIAVFRAVQGIAAALVMPSAFSIITNTFTETSERGKAIGIFGSFAAIGSGLGLSLGGLIATYFGWQWVFFINVPVISLTLWLGYIYIEKDKFHKVKSYPDILSAVLLTGLIMLLSYTVHELRIIKTNLPLFLILLAAIVLGSFLFIKRSNVLKDPLINFSLFKHKTTIRGNGLFLILGALFSGFLFTVSILLQNNMQYSAAKSGLILFPFSILSALVSKYILPLTLGRFSIAQTASLGMFVMFTGTLAMFFSIYLDYNLPFLLLSAACISGCGMAICFPSFMVMSIQEVPAEFHGLASSMPTTSYFLGAGLGLSVLGLFLQINNHPLTSVIVLGAFAIMGLLWLLASSNVKKRIQERHL